MVHNQRIAWAVLLCFEAMFLCVPPLAHAQEASDPATAPPAVAATLDDKQVYAPADFARFAPHNALDMLHHVPGFTIRSDGQDRGLGQASENVLLNGQRVPSKSGGAVAELKKISADQVERIEIVNGTTLDIPGLSGQVANVITKTQSKSSGQFSWRPEFRAHFADPIFTRGDISFSGKSGPLGYTLGLNSDGGRGGAGGGTIITNAERELIEFRDDSWHSNYDAPKASVRLTLDGPGSSVGNANIAYEIVRNDSHEKGERTRPDGADSSRSIRSTGKGWGLDLGGDLAFDLTGGRLKLIVLLEIDDRPFATTVITRPANGSPETGDKVTGDSHSKELIGRAEYGWKWGRSDFQLSAEAAYNSLESTTHLFQLDPAGSFAEIPFPAGSGQVSEDRYELLASYGRPLSSSLTMQLVAGGEHSTLAARGVARTFLRPKGSLSLAWKVDSKTDLSLKLARVVGQLNFGDFLASVNLTDNRENAGNANLVPQQSWEVDLELNRKLGAWGTTRLRLYGRRIDDILDFIPIGADGESWGNLDRAKRYGLEWESTFLLDPIGWKGVKLDATVRFQRSSLRDPLTGETRSISRDMLRQINLDLRHDIPGSAWAWGAYLNHYWSALSYRLTEVNHYWEGPVWLSAYIEHKDVFGLTVRASIDNIANARNRSERTVFDGRRTDPVRSHESRDRLIGPIFSFSVRGNF